MSQRNVVVVGAPAYKGKLTLLGDEPHLPYDRPPLSKEYVDGGKFVDLPYFGLDQLADSLGIELLFDNRATGLDTDERTILVEGVEIPTIRLS